MHKGSEVSRLSSQVLHMAETFSDCCAEKQQVIEELHTVKEELREMERVKGKGKQLSELNRKMMIELLTCCSAGKATTA